MTALGEYAKLEAEAVFYDSAADATLQVILSFGERSLVIMSADDRALAHWPLASLHARTDPGNVPAQIAPDREASDYIVLHDQEMIRAVNAVCPDLHDRSVPEPARHRRRWIWWVAIAGCLAVAVYAALPTMLAKLVDRVTPEQEARFALALTPEVLAGLDTGRTGLQRCSAPEGAAALRSLVSRLEGGGQPAGDIAIVDLPVQGTLVLPGGRVLIFRGLQDQAASPEALAGIVAHQLSHHAGRDPLRHAMAAMGVADQIKLAAGSMPEPEAISTAAAAFLRHAFDPAVEAEVEATGLAKLSDAGLPTGPYAELLSNLQATSGQPLAMINRHPGLRQRAEHARAADKIGSGAFQPALDDRSWLALGNICDETVPLR